MYNLSLMLAMLANERREVVVMGDGQAEDNIRGLPDVRPEPPDIGIAVDPATPPGWECAAHAEPWPPAFHVPPRGRVVSQAKGPNRAQRRGR